MYHLLLDLDSVGEGTMEHSNFAGQPYLNEYILNEGQSTSNTATPYWPSILSPTRISCSALLKATSTVGRAGPPIQSHTFLNIDVDNIFLSKREGTHSILIGTLLAFLRDRMPLEPTVSRDLANVINGVGSPQELLSVANIRVLFFGDDIQSPSYGYRSLVLLSSVRVEKSVPPATDMQLDQELLAVDPGNNSITENFLRLWAPFRVKAETHFIVIFTDLSTLTPNLSRHGSPFTHIRSTSTPRSRHSPIGFQAPSPIGALTSLHGLSDASFETSRTGSPTIGMAINRQLSDSPSAHQFPSTPFSQDSAGDHLVPGTSVETVCRSHGITDEALRAAEYKPAEKTFLGKVLNHRRMLEVLVKLRLQERYGIIFTPSRSVTYVGGLQLAAVDVLMAYGWSIDSYKHKTVWFGWAEEVSSRQWVKPIPTQGTELQRYQCWQGIRYIWAAGGPLDLGFFPNNASASPEGQLALKFKQKHIETYRSSINDHLDTLQAAQQAT